MGISENAVKFFSLYWSVFYFRFQACRFKITFQYSLWRHFYVWRTTKNGKIFSGFVHDDVMTYDHFWHYYQDSKIHGANMGPTWVLSAPDGPHVGPMNLAIRVALLGRDDPTVTGCVFIVARLNKLWTNNRVACDLRHYAVHSMMKLRTVRNIILTMTSLFICSITLTPRPQSLSEEWAPVKTTSYLWSCSWRPTRPPSSTEPSSSLTADTHIHATVLEYIALINS